MLKTAVVGIGNMGATHLICHKNSEYVQPVAVVDIYEDHAEKILENIGLSIPVYSNIEEMIKNEKPDLVDIVTPTYTHKELSVKAMNLGCHVLCEKPMALSVEDCVEMIEASKATGKRLMIAHVVRFMAPYMYLKNAVDTEGLGKLLHLSMTRNSGIPLWSRDNWMIDVKKSGGEVIDLSIHDIDFACYLLGKPIEVSSIHREMKENTEFSSVNLTYEGTSVNIEGGWYATQIPFKANFTAYFENGVIESNGVGITENGKAVEITDETEAVLLNGKPYTKDDAYRKEIEYFVDCIENNIETSAVLPESSMASVAACIDILKNSEVL